MRRNYQKKSFGTCGKILLLTFAILFVAAAIQAESYQESEAIVLAKKFDWKKIKSKVQSLR